MYHNNKSYPNPQSPTPSPSPTAPTVSAAVTTQLGTVGTPITFTATTSGSVSKVTWYFGDGITGTGNVVNHTYSYPGEYLVFVNATGPSGYANNLANMLYITITPGTQTNSTIASEISQPSLTFNATYEPNAPILNVNQQAAFLESYLQPPTAANWSIGYYVINFGDNTNSTITPVVYNTTMDTYNPNLIMHTYKNPGFYVINFTIITYNQAPFAKYLVITNQTSTEYLPSTYYKDVIAGEHMVVTELMTVYVASVGQKAGILKGTGNIPSPGVINVVEVVPGGPYSSLDPRMLIKDIVAEPLFSFGWNKKDAYSRVQELLEKVGLPQEFMYRFPHELSGGQRQRVAIARALALNPEFIVLDEPTSALDVSVQAQVLNLLEDLRKEFNLTMLFITHHILVVKHISDRIMVMYLVKIVESAKKEDIFKEPKHPYTQALLSSVPIPDPRVKVNRIFLEGDVPSPINPSKGCFFHPRCKHAFEPCGFTTYELVEPLRFVLDNRRNPELGNLEIQEINIIDDLNMEITFNNSVDRGTVESIIQKEKEETRALFGIKEISVENNIMKIKMHNPIEPKLKDIGNEHLVACHLVNPP
ncbi:MAG: oligopeptide/dipeptide ABC transporter ATP-binding protein [Thermoplasmata archaeon]